MTAATHPTREAWLNAFTDAARPIFADRGHAIPERVRVSIGFTSGGRRSRAIGECWNACVSSDDHFEIFLRPSLETDSRIADVLTHELIHAAVGLEAKHGKLFKRCMAAVGLTGKATATVAGPDWHSWADPILAALGPMPRGTLSDGANSGKPKQSTRMLKLECPDCGFSCRTTAKHIDANPEGLRCPSLDCDGMLNAS
jgi:hypothetical protein